MKETAHLLLFLLALPRSASAESPCPNVGVKVRPADPASTRDAAASRELGEAFAGLRAGDPGALSVVLDVSVATTIGPDPHPRTRWCAEIAPTWWDGTVGQRQRACTEAATKGFAAPRAPSRDQIDRDIVGAAATLLEAGVRDGRWTLRLAGRRGDADVIVLQSSNDRSERLRWTGTDGTLDCLALAPVTIEFRGCRVSASAGDATVQLDTARILHVGFQQNGEPAGDRLTLVPGRAETVGLMIGESLPKEVALACGGKPQFELTGKDVEASRSGDGVDQWTWSVRAKAEDGSLIFNVTSSAGGQVEPNILAIPFSVPWYRRVWSIVLAVVTGVIALVKSLQEIIKAWRSWRGKDPKSGEG